MSTHHVWPKSHRFGTLLFSVVCLAAASPGARGQQLTADQLEAKIAQLQPIACSGDTDAGTLTMQSVLASYKTQYAAKLQGSLNDPARKKAVDALPDADRKALASVWDAKLALLQTVCPSGGAVAASSSGTASPTGATATASLSTPQPAAVAAKTVTSSSSALTLHEEILGTSDPHQREIQSDALARAASYGSLSASPLQLNFEPQDVATASAPQLVTLKDIDPDHDLYLIGIEVPGKNYVLSENTCQSKLPKDASCTFKVAFSPFNTENDQLLSKVRVRYVDTKPTGPIDESTVKEFPITLRGSAIHWKFPFTRAVAGLDVSAISAKPTNFHYFVEFNLTAPVGRFLGHSKELDPLDSRVWVFLNPRLTSVPSTSSAIDNLNPSLDSFNSLVSSNLTKVGQGIDANLGLEFALLKARDGIGWWSDFPNSQAKLAVSAVFGGGAITPFSSDKTQQNAALNQSVLDAYPGQVSPLLPSACIDPTTHQLVPSCAIKFISFLTPERSRFFRKYYAGLRFKTFFFNEDVPGVCSKGWTASHAASPCTAPYNIFPGTFDITVGQDESVTGGSPHGMVWRLDAVYPLHFLPSLHVFGSIYGTFQKNQNSRPFQLVQPTNTDTLTDANTVRFLVPIQNRDYYRIGLGVDLIQLFKKNDAGQPDTALSPKDAAKNSAKN